MARKRKRDLVDDIIARRGEIMKETLVEKAVIDSLIPLSAMEGRIISINNDGTVTIEFSGPIQSYFDMLTVAKIRGILDLMDEVSTRGNIE
jgi:hypothetical protein